jgi:peptidoglycan biosynthesis protein MviN/MurJ (putative lipid II flippase)
MNITVIVIELVIFCGAFLALVVGMMLISPLTFVSDYPPEIQAEYYRSQHKEATKEKLTALMIVKKVVAIIIYLFLFAWMMHIAGAETFGQGVLLAYFYMFVWFAWDTFFIDWVLFPNIKRFRLPGTEHMDKEYHQKWFHVKVCFPVIPVAAVAGLLCAGLMIWIW